MLIPSLFLLSLRKYIYKSWIVQKYWETNSVRDHQKPSLTIDSEDCFVILTARKSPTKTVPTLSNEIKQKLWNWYFWLGYYKQIIFCKVLYRKILACPEVYVTIEKNPTWMCHEHRKKHDDRWRNVLFSDATRIDRLSDNRHIGVWRNPNRQDGLDGTLARFLP